jgi:predicted transcriptional regulator
MRIARRLALIALIVARVACAQTLQPGSALPQIKGTSLENQEITLPDAAAGKVTFLIITFSKAAGERSQGWSDRFFKDYPQDDKVTSYAIAMLEDVPSLLRGMVRGGIKRSAPASMRRRFLTVVNGEAEWKRYVGMQDDKDAYLILLDNKGRVQWAHHGQFEQAVYDVVKTKIAQMLSGKTS